MHTRRPCRSHLSGSCSRDRHALDNTTGGRELMNNQNRKPAISPSPSNRAYNTLLKSCFLLAQQIQSNFKRVECHLSFPLNEIKLQEMFSETKWMTVLDKELKKRHLSHCQRDAKFLSLSNKTFK